MGTATARCVRAAVALMVAAWLAWNALRAQDVLLAAGLAALGAAFLGWAVLEAAPRLGASLRGAVAVVGTAAMVASLVLIVASVATGVG